MNCGNMWVAIALSIFSQLITLNSFASTQAPLPDLVVTAVSTSPNASVQLTPNNGNSGGSTWIATKGNHTPSARVNRVAESDMNNHSLGVSFPVEEAITTNTLHATPVGLDAYTNWFEMPYLRLGVRAHMISTANRNGGNDDSGNFYRQEVAPSYKSTNLNVIVDEEGGPGYLYFSRQNRWHGTPMHIIDDGQDFAFQSSGTVNPYPTNSNSGIAPFELFSGLLSPPLALDWNTTAGSGVSWAPIPYQSTIKIGYEHIFYATGYFILHKLVPDFPTSSPVNKWDGNFDSAQLAGTNALLNAAGTDISAQTSASDPMTLKTVSGTVESLAPGNVVQLAQLSVNTPSEIRAISISIPRDDNDLNPLALSRARLRVTWDRSSQPSIDAPIALFFGAGTLFKRDHIPGYLVKALLVNIQYTPSAVLLNCYFPMPFGASAKIELSGVSPSDPDASTIPNVFWQVKYRSNLDPFEFSKMAHFHATYREFDLSRPTAAKEWMGIDLTMLDTETVEGGGHWSGHIVGTVITFSHNANLSTLEGDPRFFFDDSQTAQVQGTGTEEWGGGGDYWLNGLRTSLPLIGHPVGQTYGRTLAGCRNPNTSIMAAYCRNDLIESEYQLLVADLMPFGAHARVGIEHGGTDTSVEHYESVVYWYGVPKASLVLTDQLTIGNSTSEAAHQYRGVNLSPPYSITSNYEQGPFIAPKFTACSRFVKGSSQFDLRVDPNNYGMVLRRMLDYGFPDQRALLEVADVSSSALASNPQFQAAGIWKTPGSTTYLSIMNTHTAAQYGLEPEELYGMPYSGVYQGQSYSFDFRYALAVTGGQFRFRDDEFILPIHLTQGKSKIRIRVTVAPLNKPLWPGKEFPSPANSDDQTLAAPGAWTEMSYSAYVIQK